jgi:hypothetical protein
MGDAMGERRGALEGVGFLLGHEYLEFQGAGSVIRQRWAWNARTIGRSDPSYWS